MAQDRLMRLINVDILLLGHGQEQKQQLAGRKPNDDGITLLLVGKASSENIFNLLFDKIQLAVSVVRRAELWSERHSK